MRVIVSLGATLVALAVFPPSAAGSSVTGNEFIQDCNSDEPMRKIFCYGYVAGMLDGMAVGRVGISPLFCLPANVTVGQVADMTLKALREQPQTRHLPMRVTLAVEVIRAFPCKQ